MSRRAGWVALVLALAALPWVAGEYYVNLSSQILIAAIFAASLNLLVGYGGLTSLGHASYLGVAAYVSAGCPSSSGSGTGSPPPRRSPRRR